MYMELPVGIETKLIDRKSHVLKLLKNLSHQKQAWVWNDFFTKKLFALGFEQKSRWVCILSRVGNFHYECWSWDVLRKIWVPTLQHCKEFQDIGLDIEDQGHQADYVGVNTQKRMIAPMNSQNVPSLIPSWRMLISIMPRQQQSLPQLLSKSHSTLSKIPLTSTMTSTTP